MKTPQVLREEAARLLAEANRIEERPVDDFENGSIITFDKSFGSAQVYSYAAIKANGQWHRTGRPTLGYSDQFQSWTDLLNFIGDENIETIHYVTALKPLV